ncbi:hypothetical protein B0T18DRAFT_389187 [Schizothecium vesticola]|uniref:DUF7924 domain-containing protein n=1 Tax=Schizothecium vesticola TaxID=314040 RepID=A0AA40F2E7_9PEZI|nr:hypothetical protein B0T18DRAFT_389187 [Schizothecium vesticola]
MYFPFLTCEVKCGDGAIDVGDRQNAHSMTLAVRGIVELFRFSPFPSPMTNQSVRIYGHYAVLDGKNTKYYRHPLRRFYFAEQGGENDRWTAYQFTKNVYDKWMPKHYENICSAINQLPSDLVPPLSEATGPSADPPTSTSEQDIEQQGLAKRRKCG